MRAWPILLCLLVLASPVAAGEAPTAHDVTEPGRSIDRALDLILGPTEGKRAIYFLLDPTPSLQAAEFDKAFERAIARNADHLGATQLGLAVTGRKKPAVNLFKAGEVAEAVPVVKDIVSRPTKAFRNVFADARQAAGSLAGRAGHRELVLVTLENGDTEDDVEATVSALRRSRIRFSAITREAFLADSFWISSSRAMPRGVTPGAGDGPYVSLPWGWLFQQTLANETTPSGFAQYGLNRLAQGTDGKIFLYAAPSTGHRCAYYGSCAFCAEDHLPQDESFQSHRMRAVAPLVTSRSEAGNEMARDPHLRALLKAWASASKEGFVRSRPAIRLAGNGVKPEKRHQGQWAPLLGTRLGTSRLAGKADKLIKVCDRQIASLEGDLKKAGDGEHARYRAMADFTLAMLHVTRTNLVGYAAWCRDVAPALIGKAEHLIEPPEVAPLSMERRVAGISYTPICLCHGVAPFRQLKMPGGAAWMDALDRLDAVYTAFMRKHAPTPYAMTLRHQGLARFNFTYRGTTTATPPRPTPGSTTDKPTTETSRPDRSGGSTSGGSGAPTTGGK